MGFRSLLKSGKAALAALKQSESPRYEQYRGRPLDYCREVLGVELTPDQTRAMVATGKPPYRVLVPSANNVGKSFLAACVVCYRYDCVRPGITLTTAPSLRQVTRILWREVRRLRAGAREKLGGWAGPKIPLLEADAGTWAAGYTARNADNFQGMHGEAAFVIFDEAEGVEADFWEAAEPMIGADGGGFLAIYNPTSQSAPTVEAELDGKHDVVRISALDHPNIAAEIWGRPAPYPSAIRLSRLVEQMEKWGTKVNEADREPGDVELQGQWYRPGPVAQARLLGLRPSQAFDSVWSEWQWEKACRTVLPILGPLQVGADLARFGDDFTAFHVRRGGVSLHHESHNGWDTLRIANRLRRLCWDFGRQQGIDPKKVLVAMDGCGGYAAGPFDAMRHEGYAVVEVNVSSTDAVDQKDFPNLRSALWFGMAEAAGKADVSFAPLDDQTKRELRRQFLAPKYQMDVRGRRVVEPKERTKETLKRSPDDADATLLSYANVRVRPDRASPGVRVPG